MYYLKFLFWYLLGWQPDLSDDSSNLSTVSANMYNKLEIKEWENNNIMHLTLVMDWTWPAIEAKNYSKVCIHNLQICCDKETLEKFMRWKANLWHWLEDLPEHFIICPPSVHKKINSENVSTFLELLRKLWIDELSFITYNQ